MPTHAGPGRRPPGCSSRWSGMRPGQGRSCGASGARTPGRTPDAPKFLARVGGPLGYRGTTSQRDTKWPTTTTPRSLSTRPISTAPNWCVFHLGAAFCNQMFGVGPVLRRPAACCWCYNAPGPDHVLLHHRKSVAPESAVVDGVDRIGARRRGPRLRCQPVSAARPHHHQAASGAASTVRPRHDQTVPRRSAPGIADPAVSVCQRG